MGSAYAYKHPHGAQDSVGSIPPLKHEASAVHRRSHTPRGSGSLAPSTVRARCAVERNGSRRDGSARGRVARARSDACGSRHLERGLKIR